MGRSNFTCLGRLSHSFVGTLRHFCLGTEWHSCCGTLVHTWHLRLRCVQIFQIRFEAGGMQIFQIWELNVTAASIYQIEMQIFHTTMTRVLSQVWCKYPPAWDPNISNISHNYDANIYLLGHILALLARNLWRERMSLIVVSTYLLCDCGMNILRQIAVPIWVKTRLPSDKKMLWKEESKEGILIDTITCQCQSWRRHLWANPWERECLQSWGFFLSQCTGWRHHSC